MALRQLGKECTPQRRALLEERTHFFNGRMSLAIRCTNLVKLYPVEAVLPAMCDSRSIS